MNQVELLTRWLNTILMLCMLLCTLSCIYVGVKYIEIFW